MPNNFVLDMRFQVNTGDARKAIQAVKKDVQGLSKTTQASANSNLKQSGSLTKVSQASRKTGQGMNQLNFESRAVRSTFRDLTAAAAGFFGIYAAGRVIGLADEYTLLRARLSNVTDSKEQQLAVEKELLATSLETRTELAANLQIYSRIALSRKELNRSAADILKFTSNIQKLTVISGASAIEAKAAIIQLSQGLASGELRGEELRSVMEQLPAVTRVLSDELGLTVGQLREMAHQGQLTSDIVIDSILKASDGIEQQFNRIPLTIGQSLTNLQTRFVSFIDEINTGVGATSLIATSIDGVSQNMDNLGLAAGIAAGIMATRFLAAGIIPVRTGLTTGVAAIRVYDVATKKLSLTMTASAASARIFATSLALVGGPVGALALAAGGIYLFSQQESEADRIGRLHNETLAEYNRLTHLGSEVTDQQRQSVTEKLEQDKLAIQVLIEKIRLQAQSNLLGGGNTTLFNDNLKQQKQQELIQLEQQLKQIQDNINNVQSRDFGTKGNVNLNPKISSPSKKDEQAFQKQLDQAAQRYEGLQTEITLHDQGSAAIRKYRIENELVNSAQQKGIALTSELRSTIDLYAQGIVEAEDKIKSLNDTDRKHAETIKNIDQELDNLKTPYQRAIDNAKKWRQESLSNLDQTKAGYSEFAGDIETIYSRKINDAGRGGLDEILGIKHEELSENYRAFRAEISSTFADIISGSQTAGQAFEGFANRLLKRLIEIRLESQLLKPLDNLFRDFSIDFTSSSPTPTGQFTSGLEVSTVPSFNSGLEIQSFASGGFVDRGTGYVVGPGTSKSDSIPAFISNREFIVNGDATRKHRALLEAINNGQDINSFANGGYAGGDDRSAPFSLSNNRSAVQVNIKVIQNASGVKSNVQQQSQPNGDLDIEIFIDSIEKVQGDRIRNGQGLAPAIRDNLEQGGGYG